MPNELARAKAAMLDLDADTIIAAIEQLAAKNGPYAVQSIYYAASDAYGIVPVIDLDPRDEMEDWNEANPDAQLTLEQVKEACNNVAQHDWSWQRDAIVQEVYDILRRMTQPLTPPTP
jgi:hypothetical protein